MKVSIADRWDPKDAPIYFVHNFTDVRVDYDMKFGADGDSVTFLNDSIPLSQADYKTGQWVLYNETEIREFHFIVNGKFPTEGKYLGGRYLELKGYMCKVNCYED